MVTFFFLLSYLPRQECVQQKGYEVFSVANTNMKILVLLAEHFGEKNPYKVMSPFTKVFN